MRRLLFAFYIRCSTHTVHMICVRFASIAGVGTSNDFKKISFYGTMQGIEM